MRSEISKTRMDLSVLLTTAAGLGLTYAYQLLVCLADSRAAGLRIAMLFLSGLPIVLVQLIYALAALKLLRAGLKEVCLGIIISSLIFSVLMFSLFQRIPVPYALIPAREMSMGFLQLLTAIFADIAAAVCVIVSGTVLILKKSRIK